MGTSYVRGYRDPHKGLRILSVAARSVPGLSIMRVPMHVPSAFVGKIPRSLAAPLFRLYGHWLMRVRARQSEAKWLLVREFLSLPLLLVSPMLFGIRHKLYFLCQHNINFAQSKLTHRWALSLLHRMGFRFVLYENVEAWEVVSGRSTRPDGVFALPLPLPQVPEPQAPRADQLTVLGFIGNFRGEKTPFWAMEAARRASSVAAELRGCVLLVGTPDREVLARCAGFAKTIDTTHREEYFRALRSCDVVVLPYSENAYSNRTSGILAEAVASGCAVVVPDVPVLRQQIVWPEVVGTCYSSRGLLVHAVRQAISLRRSEKFEHALRAHSVSRGLSGLEYVLGKMVRDEA